MKNNFAPSKEDIDKCQDATIAEMRELDKKHDSQFIGLFVMNTLYLIWLTAITGLIILGRK
jgi:hypothetical protein